MLDSKIKNKLGNIQYGTISQERSILSVSNVEGYYPTEESAPAFTLQTENESVGCFTSLRNGRLDLVKLRRLFGFQKLKLADREKIKSITGHGVGTIPSVGLKLPCLFDKRLLRHDLISGGAGDELLTLKILPKDLLEVNEIISMLEQPQIQIQAGTLNMCPLALLVKNSQTKTSHATPQMTSVIRS